MGRSSGLESDCLHASDVGAAEMNPFEQYLRNQKNRLPGRLPSP